MFFSLSKILFFLLDPAVWITGFALLVLIFGKISSKKLRIFVFLIFCAFYAVSTKFVSFFLLSSLESIAENTYEASGDYDYIIVLSGYVDIHNSVPGKNGIEFNGAVDRYLKGLELLKRHPEAKLILSGGNGSLRRELPSEAELAGKYAVEEMGVSPSDLIIERDSRNTYENAYETLRLIPKDKKTLLITSAFHMPRSLGAFRANGHEPDTLPVDYKNERDVTRETSYEDFIPSTFALRSFIIFAKEVLGIIAYSFMGYYSFSL